MKVEPYGPYWISIKHRLFELVLNLGKDYLFSFTQSKDVLFDRLLEIARENDFCIPCYYNTVCNHVCNVNYYCLQGHKQILCGIARRRKKY